MILQTFLTYFDMTRDQFIKELLGSNRSFKRANNDVNGNPRYVAHWFWFVKDTSEGYDAARAIAKSLGWRQYRGRDFGGGFVTQSYNINSDLGRIWDKIYDNDENFQ